MTPKPDEIVIENSDRSYDPNDFEDGPLELGDPVILKEKYLGTCRYIGPIEEKIISDEIFVGIELDDDLTKNSGVFGSRQYFDCAYGYGLMVPLKKVRKVKDYTKKGTISKQTRSKSISDMNRLKVTRSEEGKAMQRKVSTGYDFIKRSKSSSNLAKCKLMPKGTMEILEDYKSYQEKERGALKSLYNSGYSHYNDIDHIYDSMALDYNSADSPHPDWDQMRQSFLKIVKPRNSPSRYRSYSPSIEDTIPNRSSFGSFESANLAWPTGTAYDDGSFLPSSNLSSRRTSTVMKSRRSRDVITVRKLGLSSDQSSDSSGVGSYDEKPNKKYAKDKKDHEPLLQAFVALRRNICDDCAQCDKCAPSQLIPIDDVDKIRNMEYLPINTCPDEAVKTHKKSVSKRERSSKTETRRHSGSKSDRRPSIPTLSQQWRAKHGCSMETGMTRGLNKLMYAINS